MLKEEFPNNIIGYSDHTIGISACLYAVSKGAKILEKHFEESPSRPGSSAAARAGIEFDHSDPTERSGTLLAVLQRR